MQLTSLRCTRAEGIPCIQSVPIHGTRCTLVQRCTPAICRGPGACDSSTLTLQLGLVPQCACHARCSQRGGGRRWHWLMTLRFVTVTVRLSLCLVNALDRRLLRIKEFSYKGSSSLSHRRYGFLLSPFIISLSTLHLGTWRNPILATRAYCRLEMPVSSPHSHTHFETTLTHSLTHSPVSRDLQTPLSLH